MKKYSKFILIFLFAACFTGCSHSIVITPPEGTNSEIEPLEKKSVVYVMTDEDRNKEVVTDGGGGDRVKYQPYRDLEKVIRDVLKSIYQDVYVVSSSNDHDALKKYNASFVFTPEIKTVSSSPSIFTWPPTKFSIEVIFDVTDSSGNLIARPKVTGVGKSEYSEWKSDFALSAKRAATDFSVKMQKEIRANPKLK